MSKSNTLHLDFISCRESTVHRKHQTVLANYLKYRNLIEQQNFCSGTNPTLTVSPNLLCVREVQLAQENQFTSTVAETHRPVVSNGIATDIRWRLARMPSAPYWEPLGRSSATVTVELAVQHRPPDRRSCCNTVSETVSCTKHRSSNRLGGPFRT